MTEMFEVVATGQATLTDDGDVVVEIVNARQGAIKIHARDLAAGDALFDTTGGTHKIVDARPRPSGQVRTERHDGWIDYFDPTDIVTILPDGNVGRELALHSSGSVQGYIETGFYSTLDEDRDINPHNYDQEVCS